MEQQDKPQEHETVNYPINKLDLDFGLNRYNFLKSLNAEDLTEYEVQQMKMFEEIHFQSEEQKENQKEYWKKVRESVVEVEKGEPAPVVEPTSEEVIQPTDCSLVNNYDWNKQIAYAICLAESGGNPKAFNGKNSNGTNDAGLMQINSIHVKSGLIGDQERLDPEANMKAAYAIYKGSGFKAWSAFNNKSYERFL